MLNFSIILEGQIKSMDISKKMPDNYIHHEKQFCNKFNIKQLTSDTSFDEFYRINNERQIIEVWQNDTIYGGQVINYTFTYIKPEKRKTIKSKLIYNKLNLTSDTAKIIFQKFQSIKNIPDMNEINGWSQGLDGVTYKIENSTKNNYSIKSYWTPTEQNDTTPYKKQMIEFTNYIYNDLNLYNQYRVFTKNLPNGTYTDGFVVIRKMGRFKSRLFRYFR